MSLFTILEAQIVDEVRSIAAYPQHRVLLPDDLAWICFETLMGSGAYRDLWPRQAKNRTEKRVRLTLPIVNGIFRVGCERFLTRHVEWLRSLGLLESTWSPTPESMLEIFLYRLSPWHHEVLPLVLSRSSHVDPRLRAIQFSLWLLKAKFIDPMKETIPLRTGFLRAAMRKSLPTLAMNEATERDVLSLLTIAIPNEPDILFVGADGSWRVNFDRLFDVSRGMLRKGVAVVADPLDGPKTHAIMWSSQPEDALEQLQIRRVREVLECHRKRGGASETVARFLLGELNQSEASATARVSRKTIDRIAARIKDEIRRAI